MGLIIPVENKLILRQVAVEDSEVFFSLIDSCREHLNQHGQNIADKYPTLDSFRKRASEKREGEWRLGIWDELTLAGFIKLTEQNLVETEIGYWLAKQFSGRGYMTKSVRSLTDYAIHELKYDKIIATVKKDSGPSINVLERCDYRNMGTNPAQESDFLFKYP